MRHSENRLEKDFKSLNHKITMSDKENDYVLNEINQRMNKNSLSKNRIHVKYYLATIAMAFLVIVLAGPQLKNSLQDLLNSPSSDGQNDIGIIGEQDNIVVTTDYKEALRTANEFLIAWQKRDPELGQTLLTEELIGKTDSSDLVMYFTGTSNPYHHSFEIVGKEKVEEGEYHFHVWLYENYTGVDDESSTPIKHGDEVVTLEVVRVNESDIGGVWKVNNLP
ncbi:hypothetical protein [Robertmurraya andreesenii]|uniref:DUF4829 domain-containing protein n=1 Tax=Anoxybacillus andreesenii TaxID=1325932 RepID=A0ABT9V9H4_9BACL|nr:hypothetical protein [Robertmurraya andreesenii]MDQ0157587.1 hypothetical protein [Robertmurraya andreesenii]